MPWPELHAGTTFSYVWDVSGLVWIKAVPAGAGVGGGGDASAANQLLGNASLASIDTKLTNPLPVSGPLTDTQLRASAVPVTANAGTNLNTSLLALETTQGAGNTLLGAVTEAAPASDTASSGLNGRLQRIAQRISSLITALGSPFQAGASIGNTSFGATQATATNLNAAVVGTGTAGTPAGNVLTIQGVAAMTKLLVTPDSVALPANQSVNVAQMAGVAPSLNTGVRDAGTQRVTIATNDSVPVTGTFFQATQPVSGTVTITPPTLTKGTQGATGESTQDLKDAGRNVTNIFMAAPIITTVAEVMQSFVAYKSGAAVGATATPAVVTAGKTYRINSIEIHYVAATVIGGALVRMRVLAGGVALIGSPLYKTFQVGIPAIFTAGAMMTYVFNYPDGLEIPAGAGIAFGVQGVGADGTTGTITGKIMIVVNGYEY